MADKLSDISVGEVTLKVFSEGEELSGQFKVKSVYIHMAVNKIASASLQVSDGGSEDGNKFELSASGFFDPGREIEIKAGYASENKTIFKGIVVKHGMKIVNDGSFLLNIECKDEAVKLSVGRKNAYFQEKTDSDIIKEILSDYSGLSATIESTDYINPELVQNYTSDWDFILQRSELNGLQVFNANGEIIIAPALMKSAPVLEIVPGNGLVSFNAHMDVRNQSATVKTNAWNREQQEVISESSASAPEDIGGSMMTSDLAKVIGLEEYNLQTTSSLPSEVLQKWAAAKHAKSAYAKIQGNIVIYGYPKLKLGDSINIDGLSDQFNGDFYVGGFEHYITAGEFITTIQLGLSAEFFSNEKRDIAPPPASGLISPVKGLHIGVVEQIHQDDNGEFRIKVKLPTLQVDNLSVWARQANFYASIEAGMFFYPEINDEVIVGFLNEDPQSPIILGSLYNKNNSVPPYEPAEDNFVKAIVTKTGLRIEFNEENNAINIITPGEQSVYIDDTEKRIVITDINQNVIEMNEAGINMTTPGDLIFEAKGNIEMNASGNIAITATGDLTGKGMNVELTGSTKFAAAAAMTEINGSGQTTIKGGVVMIN